MVSARFSYLLKDWTNSTWTQEPPDFDFMQGETLGVAELGKLPFGATFDPVRYSDGIYYCQQYNTIKKIFF